MSMYKSMDIDALMSITDNDFKHLYAKDRSAILARMNWLHADMSGNRHDVASRRKPIEKRMQQLQKLHDQVWGDFWRAYQC